MQTAEAKIWDKDEVLALIERSNEATGRALWCLYERQTDDEQASNTTRDNNGVGFNGRDAEFLSSIAKRLPNYGFKLTERQLPHVRRKLRKYTRQLLEVIEAKGGKVNYKPRKSAAVIQPTVESKSEAISDDRSEQYGMF